MASVPLTEQDVSGDWLVLNLQEVRLSDEQFVALCADNRELHLELTAQKELVIMTLPGGKTGRRNSIISARLENWAQKDGTGITFAPLTLFELPNGAKRAPDASWLRLNRSKAREVSDASSEDGRIHGERRAARLAHRILLRRKFTCTVLVNRFNALKLPPPCMVIRSC